jgi:hypothetical protein
VPPFVTSRQLAASRGTSDGYLTGDNLTIARAVEKLVARLSRQPIRLI